MYELPGEKVDGPIKIDNETVKKALEGSLYEKFLRECNNEKS